MPLPATIDVCKEHLFADREEMTKNNIPAVIQERLIRLRDMYNLWLNFPRKKDAEIVKELEIRYTVQRSTAYEDVRIIKMLLGDLNKSTKDYHRWKFCNMIDESYEMAKRIKDPRAMVAAADKYGKYTQLDKDDLIDRGYDKIQIQPFEPTDDPSVIGIKPIPNVRQRIQTKIKQYWNDDIEDVEFEEAEFCEDDIFHPKLKSDEAVL